MKINEIYKSIQGESTYAGLPCVFIRTSGCNLRCSYCDTTYAYDDGHEMSVPEILRRVRAENCNLVEVTGGEPLLQADLPYLIEGLLDAAHEVLIETNGSLDISVVDDRVVRIMDIKCPDSGMSEHTHWPNLQALGPKDEVKFVLCSRDDYQWAKDIIERHRLTDRVKVLLSTAHGFLEPQEVAEWMLHNGLLARLQLQLHKHIWEPSKRGV